MTCKGNGWLKLIGCGGLVLLTLTLLATHVLLPPGILAEFTHVKLLIRRVEIGVSLSALRYCNFFNGNSIRVCPDPVFVFFALR
jgi:hypothetical protein